MRTIPWLPLSLQRRLARLLPRLVSGRMEDFGLPTPNHRFLEAHPTVSSELLLRLGSGDAVAKPDVAELQGDRVRFTDGIVEPVDAIIYATGYRISFPFFDPEFISAPGNVCRCTSGCSSLASTTWPSSGSVRRSPRSSRSPSVQSKLAARWLAGDWALPPVSEMEAEIRRDERIHLRHYASRQRHTMQLDYYVYEYDLRKRVVPRGLERAVRGAGVS